VRTPSAIVHITSQSKVLLAVDSLRQGSVASRIVCDLAASHCRAAGDGGLLVVALASR
jgi:hypothetical protein